MKGGIIMEESETIKMKKSSVWKYATFLLLAVVIIGGFVVLSGDKDSSATGATVGAQQGATTLPTTPEKVYVDLKSDMIGGDLKAPVTIVEFTDYQCPFCARHFQQTVPTLRSQYVETGQANYFLKDFPLESIHPNALPAAIAAECVREQGGNEAYTKMHDLLFENQNSLSASNYEKWAKEIGYDLGNCLSSQKFKDEVRADLNEGQKSGVAGTPGTIILMDKSKADVNALIGMQQSDSRGGYYIRYVENSDGKVGVRISGAFPAGAFQKAIEAGL